MKKNLYPPVVKTMLSDTEPLTDNEWEIIKRDWVRKVVDKLTPEQIESAEVWIDKRKKAEKDASKKTRGGQVKWTDEKLLRLLKDYERLHGELGFSATEAQELLADVHGFSGNNKAKRIETKLTNARKLTHP